MEVAAPGVPFLAPIVDGAFAATNALLDCGRWVATCGTPPLGPETAADVEALCALRATAVHLASQLTKTTHADDPMAAAAAVHQLEDVFRALGALNERLFVREPTVLLYVGGCRFVVTYAHLLACPFSAFSQLAEDLCDGVPTRFPDRCAHLFPHILAYLFGFVGLLPLPPACPHRAGPSP